MKKHQAKNTWILTKQSYKINRICGMKNPQRQIKLDYDESSVDLTLHKKEEQGQPAGVKI